MIYRKVSQTGATQGLPETGRSPVYNKLFDGHKFKSPMSEGMKNFENSTMFWVGLGDRLGLVQDSNPGPWSVSWGTWSTELTTINDKLCHGVLLNIGETIYFQNVLIEIIHKQSFKCSSRSRLIASIKSSGEYSDLIWLSTVSMWDLNSLLNPAPRLMSIGSRAKYFESIFLSTDQTVSCEFIWEEYAGKNSTWKAS